MFSVFISLKMRLASPYRIGVIRRLRGVCPLCEPEPRPVERHNSAVSRERFNNLSPTEDAGSEAV
jgi:hypothetical protein